ncbi:hypothetical protein H5162_16815 [Pseudoalteromonas sp. SR41-8]|uniref:hypothetical protein n=1 Tax=Pseudoalteromonas sp. SR41-8 TaxID=2760946 RepID=UPI0015FFB1E9|nr:hypothetical protein [Pseudoalteromonas sp. SR41-8]MBB1311087.1 hypothetical protein [Pseudoalteromonas sp. SR41-8]
MNKAIIVGICLILFSCSSIPVGTMLKLSSLDGDSFLKLKPKELRTKIQIDKPMEIDVTKTKLSLELETSKGNIIFNFPLNVVYVKDILPEENWLTAIPERSEYELSLSEEAIKNFKNLQVKMKAEQPKRFSFNVDTDVENNPMNQEAITLSIFVRFSENSDYITLFDRASVKIEDND